MSTAISWAAGQRDKPIRIRTGYNMTTSTARIVRLRREEGEPVEFTGIPYDSNSPTDLLFDSYDDALDVQGSYAVEVEVWEADGFKGKPDVPVSIEVFGLGEPDE